MYLNGEHTSRRRGITNIFSKNSRKIIYEYGLDYSRSFMLISSWSTFVYLIRSLSRRRSDSLPIPPYSVWAWEMEIEYTFDARREYIGDR